MMFMCFSTLNGDSGPLGLAWVGKPGPSSGSIKYFITLLLRQMLFLLDIAFSLFIFVGCQLLPLLRYLEPFIPFQASTCLIMLKN